MEGQLPPLDYEDLTVYDLEEQNNDLKNHKKNLKLNIFQYIKIKIFGYVFIKKIRIKGWKNPLSFYAFKCDKHGLQIAHPMGWKNKLICPKCLVKKKLN